MIELSTLDIVIRIIFAILIGGAIGYEREMNNRPAGFVTHTLVCVGACVVSLIQIHMIQDTISLIQKNPLLANALKADIGRVIAQVITGVGFLGAGTIFMEKGSVKGLTTATTIWLVACIGLGVGFGYYKMSIIAVTGVGFVIIALRKFERRALNRKYEMNVIIKCNQPEHDIVPKITEYFTQNTIQIRDIKILERTEEYVEYKFKVYCILLSKTNKIAKNIMKIDGIIDVNIKY